MRMFYITIYLKDNSTRQIPIKSVSPGEALINACAHANIQITDITQIIVKVGEIVK